jgi:hypothetical protein
LSVSKPEWRKKYIKKPSPPFGHLSQKKGEELYQLNIKMSFIILTAVE